MTKQSQMTGTRVLLIDDDEGCREFLAAALEDEGLLVTQAPDAEKALETLSAKSFDAIATDMNLPGMDGITLLQNIRDNFGDVPVILITGYSSVGSAVEALKHGAQDYLVKPVSKEDLLNCIWRSVEHHRLELQNRALQKRLVRAQRMESLGILAGGVAHDLNNILSPMVAFPRLIIDQIQDLVPVAPEDKAQLETAKKQFRTAREELERVKEELIEIESSGKRAASVVQDLLTLSATGNYERRPTNINQVVRDYLNSPQVREMMSTQTGIKVKSDLAQDISMVMGSDAHLIRVVSNLVQNAFEAMGDRPDSQLTVRTSNITVGKRIIGTEVIEPGSYVLLEVSDTGAGISASDLENIFEPFFTTKEMSSNSGTGLGLSIVHGVLKDHDASVDIKSTIGKGTSFFIYFPLTREKALEQQQAPAQTEGGTEHVLVVDDEPAQRFVAQSLLRQLGYQVTTASNGREAIRLMENAHKTKGLSPFDLIILDMIMEEGFDGLNTYQRISEIFPGQKVIVASGFAATGRAKQVIDMGAGWLSKPYDLKALSTAVRQVLD